MSLQYQNKMIRIVPIGAATILKFHLGQKYAISHNLLRGDVTINILFIDDNKVIITHTKKNSQNTGFLTYKKHMIGYKLYKVYSLDCNHQ